MCPELKCWDVREVRPGLEENARIVDAGLRAAVTVLEHLTGQLMEKEGAYSVWVQQSRAQGWQIWAQLGDSF